MKINWQIAKQYSFPHCYYYFACIFTYCITAFLPQIGYKLRYLSLQTHNVHDIRAHNQMLDQYTSIKAQAHSSAKKAKSMHNQGISYDSSDSTLPWRKPPHPKPKDWPYSSNTDKKTSPVTAVTPGTPMTPGTTAKVTVSASAKISTSVSKNQRPVTTAIKKPLTSQHWQSPTLHSKPATTRTQDIPKPQLPIEIPATPYDFIPPPLPSERITPVIHNSNILSIARIDSPVSSPKHSKYTTYQRQSTSPRRPPKGSQYVDIQQSSLNGLWLDEQDNYSSNNIYPEYFELHSDLDIRNDVVAPEVIHPKVRVNTNHVQLTPVTKQPLNGETNYKSQSPYGLLRSIQSKLLNLSHSPRNSTDNNIEELNFPPSYPIARSNDDSGTIILNNDIKEALQDLVQRKRNTLEILKSKH